MMHANQLNDKVAVILRLPLEVFFEGIVECLHIHDLQQLDTAFTNRRQRPHLRNLWKSFHYSTPENEFVSISSMEWLVRIGADVEGVHVAEHLFANPITFISSHVPTLKKAHITLSKDGLTDDALIQLAHGCPQLEVLRIDISRLVTDAGIIALTQHCPNLHTIDLCNLPGITDASIFSLCAISPRMQCISLEHCHQLSDAVLFAIANSYPKLQMFECNMSEAINERSLLALAANCHELKKVKLCCDNKNTTVALAALWAANPCLIDIDLSSSFRIADADIKSLVQCCSLLRNVDLYSCYDISDTSVTTLAEHSPYLTALNIGICTNITDAALIALGSHSHSLKILDISKNKNLTVDGVTALATGCPLLQVIITSESSFDSACVIALASQCHDLRKFSISACNDIGLSAISAIAHNCPLITELVLEDTDVDDACLIVIAECCRFLTRLDIYHEEKKWSHDALVSLAACPLERLHVLNIKKRTRDEIKRKRPFLRV